MRKFLKNKMGISPIISTTLIFAILMTGVLIMYGWGLPLVIDFQDNSEVNDVTNQFYELDRNIKIVIHEGDGATRSSRFEFNKGLLNYTSSSNFSLILVSGDPPDLADPDAIIEGHNDIPDIGRMEYTLRSTMDDLSINSSSSLTGAVDAYPVLELDDDAHDAGVFAAFEEAEQNIDISRIVYTRSEFAQYSLFLEYRPVIKITAEESGGRVNRLDVWLYLVKLDNTGSFPEAGATEIIVKRIDYIPGTESSVSSNIQDQDNVYLYAIVDGVYQQLTLDFEVTGGFSLYQHIVITEIQIYDI
ncbi:MAG: hypothetical protein ACXAAM_08630 [Candidatus Heimdallarchaeaceae archaeon]|jgi:hypothetical protein